MWLCDCLLDELLYVIVLYFHNANRDRKLYSPFVSQEVDLRFSPPFCTTFFKIYINVTSRRILMFVIVFMN